MGGELSNATDPGREKYSLYARYTVIFKAVRFLDPDKVVLFQALTRRKKRDNVTKVWCSLAQAAAVWFF
jgi:hypothetical protein